MMKKTLILLPLLAIAACSTPREQCISNANGQLRTLDRLIDVASGNVQRGFALAEVQDVRVLRTTCQGTNEDGSTFRFPCEETETFTRREPVSINIVEERVKLAQLQDQRDSAARDVAARTQQCIAIHPE
ncbi:hypothetical protein N8388_04830 [Octadecabacter sp.]|jgi:hypothetical protein|nr:hypothetical protein [Octadecabacter sp.]MDC1380363.1 hypothetical protein [Octadecabacter sp.]MDC1397654.1 hypothetical protein [Octadecabacter sp.]MDC1500547.1 hypothetical protein [Octadecabacter sp.]|tara:strand:+ start:7704 stop:8093 length:390 start_codon:yes stop_codon:yes gene_type:complete